MAAKQTVTATFDGTQDSVAVAWANLGGTQRVVGGVTIVDSAGAVIAYLTNRTTTGATVNASARFSGTVDLEIATT
jgi:hypothetical protein